MMKLVAYICTNFDRELCSAYDDSMNMEFNLNGLKHELDGRLMIFECQTLDLNGLSSLNFY